MKRLLIAISASVALSAPLSIHASPDKVGVSSANPSPSPSGKDVAFSADFDGPARIWIAGLNGKGLRKIASSSLVDDEPAWSPNGRQIAFTSTNGERTDIWIVQADGTYPMKLTANGANNSQPAWSPDGSKIAFVSDKDGTNDIWIMNSDGTQQKKLVTLSNQESRPSFSPAGDKLVFSETSIDASVLKIVNTDGAGLRSLTSGTFHDWNPNWGANGIVFASNRDTSSSNWKIWAIQPDGSGLRRIGNVMGLDPVWTTDGRILFGDEMMDSRATAAVSILNPTTGEKQVVVDVQGYSTPVDIRPGKSVNRINPRSRGKAEIAILSTANFNAPNEVNQSRITFGRTGNEQSLVDCSKKLRDLNSDGLPDLKCRVTLAKTGFQSGDTVGILRFLSQKAIPYEGRDGITITPEDDPDDFKESD